MREKNSTYLYIGNVTNGYADADGCDFSTIPLGSLALVKAESTTAGLAEVEEGAIAAQTAQKFFIVAKTAQGEIRKSPMFLPGDITSANLVNYFAPREQVSFIGYDGTDVTGFDTTFVVGDSYRILYGLKHSQSVCNTTADLITAPYYALGTTQAAAAKALMESTINVFKKRGINPIIVDRVALTTSVAAYAAGTGLISKFTKGSKTVSMWFKTVAASSAIEAGTVTVTLNDTINAPSSNGRVFKFDASADAHVVIIGDNRLLIADDGGTDIELAADIIAAINADAAFSAICVASTPDTATDDVVITYRENYKGLPPIVLSSADNFTTTATIVVTIQSGDSVPVKYKVAASAALADSYELDEPWQGETGYAYTGTDVTTNAGIANLTSDTWGLKFTGNTPMTFNPITETYDVSTFNVLGGDLGTEYKSIKSHRGVGTYREVVSMENLHQGEDRHYYADSMTTRREFTAEPGKYYDMLTINLRNQNHSSPATGIAEYNYATLVLAIDRSLSYETLDAAFGLTAITLT